MYFFCSYPHWVWGINRGSQSEVSGENSTNCKAIGRKVSDAELIWITYLIFFFFNNTTIIRFSSCPLWLRTDAGCFLLFIYSFRALERHWLNSLQTALKEADLHRCSLLCSLKFRFFPDWWIISSLLFYNSAAKHLRSESRSIRLPLQAASWPEARRNVLAQA